MSEIIRACAVCGNGIGKRKFGLCSRCHSNFCYRAERSGITLDQYIEEKKKRRFKRRTCLRCGNSFKSSGRFNRICDSCAFYIESCRDNLEEYTVTLERNRTR